MDTIAGFDKALFHVINGSLTAPFLDSFMIFITNKQNFAGVVILAAALIAILGKRKDRWGLILLAFTVLSSDLVCNLLKHAFMRVRPCHALEGVRLLVGCGTSYSLPSNHAGNIFAAMVFLSLRYKRYWPAFLTVAVLVAYSRVYDGVHYPADVLAGAALGTGIALIVSEADTRYFRPFVEKYGEKRPFVE